MGRMAAAALALTLAAQSSPPLLRLQTDEFWLNLHHFLYVLGRADAKTVDSTREAVAHAPDDSASGLTHLADDERQVWRDAVAFYAAGPSRKDAVFDPASSRMVHALVDTGDRESLRDAPIETAARETLERAAAVYRKVWWPAHHAANVRGARDIQLLVDRYGREMVAFVTRAYGMGWPAGGYPVHVSAYANWAGAYSTTGNLLVVSSLDPALRGLAGLETVFHETMHQWDPQVEALLREQARSAGTRVPPNLDHAMIFFTAGEAVRRVAPEYVPYAVANGVWQRGLERFKGPLEEVWKPYLDGRGTRDEAIAALVRKF